MQYLDLLGLNIPIETPVQTYDHADPYCKLSCVFLLFNLKAVPKQ